MSAPHWQKESNTQMWLRPVLYCKTGQVTNPSEPKEKKAKVSREVKVRKTIKTSQGRTKCGGKIVQLLFVRAWKLLV